MGPACGPGCWPYLVKNLPRSWYDHVLHVVFHCVQYVEYDMKDSCLTLLWDSCAHFLWQACNHALPTQQKTLCA